MCGLQTESEDPASVRACIPGRLSTRPSPHFCASRIETLTFPIAALMLRVGRLLFYRPDLERALIDQL